MPASLQFIYLILFFGASLLLIFFVSTFMFRRAITFIIKFLRNRNALRPEEGINRDEFGIKPQHILFRKRDYRPQALQFLNNVGIVKDTDDGKIYLSEEKLVSVREESSKIVRMLLPE